MSKLISMGLNEYLEPPLANVKKVALRLAHNLWINSYKRRKKIQPISPYGVSKAACEQLATVYHERGLSLVPLRYFTVYGPRQRPDMAMNRLFRASLPGSYRFPLREWNTIKRNSLSLKMLLKQQYGLDFTLITQIGAS